MNNHYFSCLNRAKKVWFTSSCKWAMLPWTRSELGQPSATRIRTATAAVWSEFQHSVITLSSFQLLLLAMAAYPSSWVLFSPEWPTNYVYWAILDSASALWPAGWLLHCRLRTYLNYRKYLLSHSAWSRGSSALASSFIPVLHVTVIPSTVLMLGYANLHVWEEWAFPSGTFHNVSSGAPD